MIKILTPPVFENSEKTRKAKVLHNVLISTSIIVILNGIINIFVLPENINRWLAIICLYNLICFGLLLLNKKGYYRIATIVLIAFCIILSASLSWTAGGIRAGGFQIVFVIVLLSGLLLGWKGGIITGILAILLGLFFVLANYVGILPESSVQQFPLSIWITSSSTIILLALLQYYSIAGLDIALNKVTKELHLRRLAEANLLRSESFRKQVFEGSRVPIVVMDALTNQYIDCNQAAVDIYCFASREVTIGKSPSDFSAPTQYDGTPSGEKATYYIEKALQDGSVVFEWKHQRPNGEFWDAEVHLMSFEADGRRLLQFTLLDITERKKTEKALRESEERFRLVLENMPILLNAFDEKGHFIVWNKACEEVTGYSAEEMRGNPYAMDLLYPDSVYLQEVWNTSKDPTKKKTSFDLVTKNGEVRTIEWFDTYHFLTIQGWASWGMGLDITERKLAEKELVESEARFKTLSTFANEGLMIHKDGIILDVNQAFCNLFGIQHPSELIGKNSYEVVRLTAESKEKIAEHIKRNSEETYDIDIFHSNGRIIPAETKGIEIIFNGEKARLAYMRDISERKLAEQKLIESEACYRFISENTADVIWTLDLATAKFTYVSPAVERLRGYSAEEVMNQTMSESLTAESALKADLLFQNAVLLRIPGDTSIYRTITQLDQPCKNGTIVPTEVASTVLFNEKGIPSQVIGVSRDITERKQAEEKLKESEAHYRYLFEQNPVPMLIYKLESLELLAVNESFLRHYGYSFTEALSLKLTDLYPENEKLPITELAQKLKGLAYAGEWHHIKKDGTLINVEAHSHGLLFEGQESRIAVINDITQQKNIEKELIINEGRLQKLLQSVTDYIYSVAIEKGVAIKTIHGEGCIAVTGYSAEDFINDNHLWYKIIYDDDKEIAKEQISKLMNNKAVLTTEHRIIHKDGSIRWVRNTPVLRFNNDCELTGYDGLIVNITERKLAEERLKESENRYRNLFENANDAIFIMKEVRYIDCNLMTTMLFGYPKEKIINMAPWELSPKIQPDGQLSLTKAQDLIQLCIEGKPQRFEWHHMRADKTIFDAEVSLNKLELSGEVFILAIVRDISERKSFEKEVYFSTFKGEENERSRIARELHDGLGPLLSTCKIYHHNLNQLKLDSDETESYSKLGELLNESMFTIREISNNLSPHILRNFGLADAIKSFAEKLKTDIKFEINQNYEANKRYSEVMEVTLYRVIIELINNTIKHASASLIIVDLTEDKSQFFVRYKDDGEGFDYSETLKRAKGFGLFNIHSRIVSIGGKIDYKSRKNKGIDVKISINL